MPTVDIKSDYGAVGDGQLVSTTITISAANPTHLAVSSAPFLSGDVGKSIAVDHAGAALSDTVVATMSSSVNPTHLTIAAGGDGGQLIFTNTTVGRTISVGGAGAGGGTLYSTVASIIDQTHATLSDPCLTSVSTSQLVQFGGPFLTTIETFIDASHVILADGAPLEVPGLSGLVEYGTDDTSAFLAFNSANAGVAGVTLTIPDGGRYCIAAGFGGSLPIGKGVPNPSFVGIGGPTITDMIGAGAGCALNFNGYLGFIYDDNTAESFVQTVDAGATVLQMVTASDAGKYSVNSWAWMTGYDTQGFGAPPNPAFAEFVFITAIDDVVGTVTIQTPLKYGYKSTWPVWNGGLPGTGAPDYTGGAFSLGGPAKLYLINPLWDTAQTWDGVNFRSTSTLMNAVMRSLTLRNSTFEVFGPNVSCQMNCIIDNITNTEALWELDKATVNFMLSSSAIRGLQTQSRSPFNVALSNVTMTVLFNGGPANCIIDNCSLPDVLLGPQPYGAADTLSITNTFSGSINNTGSGETNINTDGVWSISSGLMSRPKAGGFGEPPVWAIPGSYFVLSKLSPVWKCIDIWDDGTTLFLQTDQSASSFPPGFDGASAVSAFAVLPRLSAYSGNSGSDDAEGWVAPRFGEHWRKTYSGNIGATDPARLIKAWGKFVSLTVTISPGYSAGTFNIDNPFVAQNPSKANTAWNPVFDLTVPGTRTITRSDVVGSAGSDANLTPPNEGDIWLLDNQITPSMSGATGSGSVLLEIITDQGFPSMALLGALRVGRRVA